MLLDKDNLIKLKSATNEQEIVDLLNEYLTKEKEVVQSQGKKVIGITAYTVLQNSDEPFILGSKHKILITLKVLLIQIL